MTAPWLYATRPVKSATSTITSRMRLIIPLFSGISGVDPNPHCLRMVVHGDQLRVALRPQSAEAGGDVELIAAARKQGLDHGERHLDVHLRPVMVLANLDQKVSAHFGDTHVLVTVLDRDELVVTGAANRVHESAKIDAVDIAPDLHLPALKVVRVDARKDLLRQRQRPVNADLFALAVRVIYLDVQPAVFRSGRRHRRRERQYE